MKMRLRRNLRCLVAFIVVTPREKVAALLGCRDAATVRCDPIWLGTFAPADIFEPQLHWALSPGRGIDATCC